MVFRFVRGHSPVLIVPYPQVVSYKTRSHHFNTTSLIDSTGTKKAAPPEMGAQLFIDLIYNYRCLERELVTQGY